MNKIDMNIEAKERCRRSELNIHYRRRKESKLWRMRPVASAYTLQF